MNTTTAHPIPLPCGSSCKKHPPLPSMDSSRRSAQILRPGKMACPAPASPSTSHTGSTTMSNAHDQNPKPPASPRRWRTCRICVLASLRRARATVGSASSRFRARLLQMDSRGDKKRKARTGVAAATTTATKTKTTSQVRCPVSRRLLFFLEGHAHVQAPGLVSDIPPLQTSSYPSTAIPYVSGHLIPGFSSRRCLSGMKLYYPLLPM